MQDLAKRLVEEQLLTPRQLARAEQQARQTGQRLPQVCLALGLLTEAELLEATSRALGLPFVDLDSVEIEPQWATWIPEHLARRHQAIAIRQEGENLLVAMLAPLNPLALDDIQLISDHTITPVLVTESAMSRALERIFGHQDVVELEQLQEMVDEAPIVRVVNLVISQAINDGASAIHLEKGRVRYRCDGILHEVMHPPEHIHLPVVARLKIMANMDIAESRIAQYGRIRLEHQGTEYELHATTLPCEGGEKIVLRLRPRELARRPQLCELGLSSPNQTHLESLLQRRAGLLLVTGGSRSGKATTLQACLRTLHQSQRCTYSIAEPHSDHQPLAWVNHLPLNHKAGLTVESALASCLRSDPDVILIGSFGSSWQLRLAVDAAGRGHLVLAGNYGSSSAQALMSLLNTGIEPYLVSQALLAVVNQRLARRICADCKHSLPAPPDLELTTLYAGAGCQICQSTGYRGQIGIQEILPNSPAMAQLLLARPEAETIHELACREGMVPMHEDALDKVRQGLISMDEMLRTLRD